MKEEDKSDENAMPANHVEQSEDQSLHEEELMNANGDFIIF